MPPELLDIIKAGGAALAPFLAFLWWMERIERKEASEKLHRLGLESMQAITETKAALEVLKDIFNGNNPRRH